MRLLNKLWEGKENKMQNKMHDHHLDTFEILIRAVTVPSPTTGHCILQRKLCKRGA